MHDPKNEHLNVVYQILRYLKSNSREGLMFNSHGHLNVESNCDVDWASCLDGRRSTSSYYYVFVGENLVSWRSKKQSIISRSTVETEYQAVSLSVSEMLWVKMGKKSPFRIKYVAECSLESLVQQQVCNRHFY